MLLHKQMHIPTVIGFVSTKMLASSGSFKQNGQDECLDKPFIVFIGAGHKNGEWQAMLIDQDMNFAAQFGSIGRVFTRIGPSQRGGHRFAVHRLPLPVDPTLPMVKTQYRFENILKDTLSAPGLKPLMNDTARYSKPMPFNRLPLTATPQNKPNGIQNHTILCSRSTRRYGTPAKVVLSFSKAFWYFSITHVLRLCVTMLLQGVSPFLGMCRNTLITDDALYFNI